jgi:transposase
VPRAGPKKVQEYSAEFKLAAVRLSRQRGVQVQAVAAALDIHPFMLSRWRKQARDGVLRGKRAAGVQLPPPREIRRLQALERAHLLLQEEHALLKKAIRFWATRKLTSSRSSTRNGAHTG